MNKYWSKIANSISPYTPGEQPKDKKYIKLNTNENPYPPSPKVLEAIKFENNQDLRLYPDPNGDSLRDALAEHYGFKRNEIFIGNGSDEVLAFSFLAFFNRDSKILYPDVTYSFYDVYSEIFNIPYEHVPLSDDFSINVEGFLVKSGGVIFPNPNAPTGKILATEDIIKIIEADMDRVVIIDEAYIDFGGESVLKYVNKYPNLLIVQTFSKSRSLAGLRIGFAIGQEHLIGALNAVKNSINSYTLDRLALVGGALAVKDYEYMKNTALKVIATRKRVAEELIKLGFTMPESATNFLFISHKEYSAATIFEKLKSRGIFVRHFNKPRIDNYLRVSIGTDEEMDKFLEEVASIVNV